MPPSLTEFLAQQARTRGTCPIAFAIARAGAAYDAPAIIAHCAQRIAKYKVPEQILLIAEFPVTPSANGYMIQKTKLREIAGVAHDGQTRNGANPTAIAINSAGRRT